MTVPQLAVGIGNTTVKCGLAWNLDRSPWPVWQARSEMPTEGIDATTFTEWLPEQPVEWCVVSVQRTAETNLRDWVRVHRRQDTYRLLTHLDIPIEIQVKAPDRVGMDRLAAAVAVNRLRDRARPAVVIDAGTAITVNLVTADGAFQGGAILPGFGLTARSLSLGTDLLPLVSPHFESEPPGIVGKSTEEAIRSGLFWGSVGAVREIVHRMQEVLAQPPQLFLTGGDAQHLAGRVSLDARFVPDLVLAGILFSVSRRGAGP